MKPEEIEVLAERAAATVYAVAMREVEAALRDARESASPTATATVLWRVAELAAASIERRAQEAVTIAFRERRRKERG